eukprot:jgi/Ulvmu1/12170/UM085_0034.1
MPTPDECIVVALQRARQRVQDLEQVQPDGDAEAWSHVILQSLAFHREQRTYWRSLVHELPAHLKEQVLAEDLGGQFDASVEIDDRKPVTPHQTVRLPPPSAAALASLKPTGTPAAAELRRSRAAASSGIPDDEASPIQAESDEGLISPQPSTSAWTGAGVRTPGLVSASKDPLRSARASPAQLPAGGLNELQAALARRRGGDS